MTVDVSALGTTEWQDLDIKKLLFFTSLATVFENSIMWPAWAMKTRQQVATGAVSHSLSFRKMGGLRSLYRGFCFYAVASLPAYLTYVTTYTYAKSCLGFHYNDAGACSNSQGVPASFQQIMAPMTAGIIADAACLTLYIPVEIAAQRLQLPTRYTGVRHVLKDMWRENGWRTFYRGAGATVVTSAIASGVWWQSYETLKKAFTAYAHAHPAKAAATEGGRRFGPGGPFQDQVADLWGTVRQSVPHMTAGFIAGGTAALITNPLDIAKTRWQTQRVKPDGMTFFRSLKVMVRQEGVQKAFLRGLVPKIVSTAPLGMLSSVMYEGILFLSRKESPNDGKGA